MWLIIHAGIKVIFMLGKGVQEVWNHRWIHYFRKHFQDHYDDVIMGAIASLITSLTVVYSTVYSDADQSKHQSSASLAFVWGIHRGPVNSPHKWPVTRKIFPFDDVIMWRKRKHQNFVLLALCQRNPSVTDGIHRRKASNTESVLLSKRHDYFYTFRGRSMWHMLSFTPLLIIKPSK